MTSLTNKDKRDVIKSKVKAPTEESCVIPDSTLKISKESAMLPINSISNVDDKSTMTIISDTKSEIMEIKSTNVSEPINSNIPSFPVAAKQSKKIPILDPVTASSNKPVNVSVPRTLSSPISRKSLNIDQRPLVLTTHLVPSLPIGLFEIIGAIIEAATNTPVVLLHESRIDRPVAEDIVDIAILPSNKEWPNGILLPIGIVFEHRFNKHKTPGVYADIVVAKEIAQNIEDIIDLRGHSCAVPDRYRKVGTAGLLFNYLKSKGENPSFFGNLLDTDTQVVTLQMVAGKQAEVGVLEAPVINCHKHTLTGVNSLFILDSLGPLPPYQIMINPKQINTKHREQIEKYLLNVQFIEDWIVRLKPYGILGFAEYSKDNYDIEDIKSVVTSVRYY
ncbi:hypothetical protein PV327_007484 [Microctonus hyperodae]|uniref:Uncharacterized protein n=1 Tax=Microctonus hyperodae TaxID=165561 RepID=A0AA39FZY8_MICHY|nr:hypothetical protein PV327_007484 [Microctonus hyperodae]